MSNILDVIGTDLKAAGLWVEKEAGVVLTIAEQDADVALKDIWAVAEPIFTAGAATETAAILAQLKAFLGGIAPGQDLATIEEGFLNFVETAAKDLLPAAENLGSMLLQALIALALKSIP